VEERLKHGARHRLPIAIVRGFEDLARSFSHNAHKLLVQRELRSQPLQRLHDLRSLILETIDLETVVIKSVNRILVSLMATAQGKEFLECG